MDAATNRQRPSTHTFNGKLYPAVPPLVVGEGQLVRLRLINATTGDTQTFALAGHTLTLTHSDGNPLAQPVPTEAVILGGGERADVEFRADNPGRWQLRGFVDGAPGAGPAIDVVYRGREADAPVPPTGQEAAVTYAQMAGPSGRAGPVRTYDLMLAQGELGSGAWTINEKAYRDQTSRHERTRSMRRSPFIAAALAAALLTAACGGDDDSEPTAAADDAGVPLPMTTRAATTPSALGSAPAGPSAGTPESTGSHANHAEAPEAAAAARVIAVRGQATRYDPAELRAAPGEQLAIELTAGDITHDLTFDKLRFHVSADPGKPATGGLTAGKAGRYAFYCSVPGHRQAGMEGVLVVE